MAAPPLAKPPRRTQEQRSAETRERLIVATIACIERYGYVEATTSTIVKEAAVSRGALQHHFPSKADLLAAVIDRVADELNLRFDVAALASEPLEVRIAALLDQYWSVYLGPSFRAVLSISLGIMGEPDLRDRLAHSLERARNGYAAIWHGVFFDLGLTDVELSSIRRFLMSASRGYGVLNMLQLRAESFDEDRRDLCALVLQHMRAIARPH
jgi:AcrR family transcriptional regulator